MSVNLETKKILLALLITATFFLAAFAVSKTFSDERLNQIKSDENDLALNIMSSETQFSLLKEPSCDLESYYPTAFSDELGSLGGKLTYMEGTLGSGNADVLSLEKYYSLLEIEDYILISTLTSKCKTKDVVIRFFYSDLNSCEDCKKEKYVLDDIRDDYADVHIYSFSYGLQLSALQTIEAMFDLDADKLPALIINDKVYYGFQSEDDLLKIVPGLAKLKINPDATTTATTTKK